MTEHKDTSTTTVDTLIAHRHMPSLLRKFKAGVDKSRPGEDSEQPTRQASLLSTPGSDSNETSLTRRFSRQLSLPIAPFRKRNVSVVTEPIAQDDCLFLTSLPYEIRETAYLKVIESEDLSVNIERISDHPKERRKQERRRWRGRPGPDQPDNGFAYLLNLMRTSKVM